MKDGHDRTDVSYVWPRTLYREHPRRKLVYLDLNHWISLAKAHASHQDGGQYETALNACIDAVESGRAIFVLSSVSYLEIANNRNYQQRRDLREVIELLTHYNVITSRPIIYTHEVEATLDNIGLRNPRPIGRKSYLDWGVLRALGMKGNITINAGDGADVTEQVRAAHPDGPKAFDNHIASQYIQLNRAAIDGPTPEEMERFRQAGWRPRATLAACRATANNEAELDRELDKMAKWRRGRIRDVVATRELMYEVTEVLYRACKERNIHLDDLAKTREKRREIFDAMPSFDVAVTLKTAYHRNPKHRWKYNDIYDIHALASTLPYCDVVVTDREMESQVRQAGLAKRLNALVLSHLSDLVEHI